VLAGLIREDNGRSGSGVPLLSKIPVLGALFGAQSVTTRRTELVLIITPRIISDAVQAREATQELRRKLPALEALMPKAEKVFSAPETPPAPRQTP
jgi:general secretion pathway protein D